MSYPLTKIKSIVCNQGAVRAVRYNVDGEYCITCGSDKSLKLWNPRKGLMLQAYAGHGYEVLDARGSCDSSSITSCGMDKCVFLWDVATAQAVRRYRAHAGQVNCVAFNEESTLILSGSVDCTVKVWDCKSKSKDPVQVLDEAKDSITSIGVSDHEIVTGCLDGKVRRYDLRKGVMDADDVKVSVSNVCFSKDGQCILVGCLAGVLRLIDKDTGSVLNEYSGHRNGKYRVESSLMGNDTTIVSGSEDGKVYFWDLIQSQIKAVLDHPGHKVVHSLDVHPSKIAILTASEGLVYLWETEEKTESE